jgi:hypothetical protein
MFKELHNDRVEIDIVNLNVYLHVAWGWFCAYKIQKTTPKTHTIFLNA